MRRSRIRLKHQTSGQAGRRGRRLSTEEDEEGISRTGWSVEATARQLEPQIIPKIVATLRISVATRRLVEQNASSGQAMTRRKGSLSWFKRDSAGQPLNGFGRPARAMPSEKLQPLVLQRIRRPKELFEIIARVGRKIADILEIRFER